MNCGRNSVDKISGETPVSGVVGVVGPLLRVFYHGQKSTKLEFLHIVVPMSSVQKLILIKVRKKLIICNQL